jgi:hypothetical protein
MEAAPTNDAQHQRTGQKGKYRQAGNEREGGQQA